MRRKKKEDLLSGKWLIEFGSFQSIHYGDEINAKENFCACLNITDPNQKDKVKMTLLESD